MLLATAYAVQPPATAQGDDAAPGRQEWVEIDSASERAIRAYVVFPTNERPTHVVVIVHENRGLTTWERGLADELAAAGYIAIAPDMLSGVAARGGGTDSFETSAAARAAIYDLKTEQVQKDLDAVVEYARKLPGADKKVAVVGFCWGGAQAFLCATHNADIAAAADFYGAAPSRDLMQQIKSPVYGFYAETDSRITGEVSKVKSQMLDSGRDFQAVTYAGAGHGFFRAGEAKDASPADRKARSEAWTRLMSILEGL